SLKYIPYTHSTCWIYSLLVPGILEFRVLSLAGKDAVLASFDHAGRIQPTPLFEQIRKDALALERLRLIILDTSADVFGGREVERLHTHRAASRLPVATLFAVTRF